MTETTTGNAVAKRRAAIDDGMLRNISSWDDLGTIVAEQKIPVENLTAYGTGVIVCDDKNRLLGVPFIIVAYAFHDGDNGEFVSAVAVTKTPLTINSQETCKVVINDGSTGILAQIRAIETERVESGSDVIQPLYCPAGLRKSTYDYEDPATGKVNKATTFYLA